MEVRIGQNNKTTFTRMCIGEAIIRMMKTTPFNKLKISEIVKTAGVARMTFYKYYDSPYTALTDYLGIIVMEYMEKSPMGQTRDSYMSYEHILFSLEFFDHYRDFFLTLDEQNLYSIMRDGVNQFMEKYILTARQMSVYELYSYAGGLLNTFIQWEKRGKKESAEEVAACLYRLYHYAGAQAAEKENIGKENTGKENIGKENIGKENIRKENIRKDSSEI